MTKTIKLLLSLSCVLALCGCATSGHVQVCPQPQPLPASLMQTPHYESKTRAILFDSPQMPTHKSGHSKPY